MNIEENIKNSESLFRSLYLNGGSEDISLSSHVLDEHGLTGNTFWEIVCPELIRRGILKNFDSKPRGLDSEEVARLAYDLDEIGHQCQSMCKLMIKNLKENVEVGHNVDVTSIFIEPHIRTRVIEPLENAMKRTQSLGNMYGFKVNGKSLSQQKETRPDGTKRNVVIDFRHGIYDGNSRGKKYEIKGAKRQSILKYVCENPTARLDDFVALTGQNDSLLVKEIGEINELFREKVGVPSDLIIHTGSAGYFLNREEFDIEIKTLT